MTNASKRGMRPFGTYEVMVETYVAYGYEPVLLPFAPVSDRAAFVRDTLNQAAQD